MLQPALLAPGGMICEPSVDALFVSMERMAREADARRQYSLAAHEIAERDYATEAMVDRYHRLAPHRCQGDRPGKALALRAVFTVNPEAARVVQVQFPRVAIVVSQLGYGGAERQMLGLLKELRGTPWEPRRIICLSENVAPLGGLSLNWDIR